MKTNKSEVKRYTPAYGVDSVMRGHLFMEECERGAWVSLEDHEALQAECEKLRKDAERLDWIVSEGAIVAHAGVRGEPHRYRVEWPLLGEVGTSWFASERDAIDAAMHGANPC